MPQFNPATFAPQLFWLVVSFIALYWLISKVAIPRVGEVIDNRARVIQEDLDRAGQLKAETEAAALAYEKAMAAARHQAQEHMRKMQAEAKAVADSRITALAEKIAAQVGEAEARIGKAKQDALAAMRELAGETARDVVAKLTAVAPDRGALDAAVAAVLKDRG